MLYLKLREFVVDRKLLAYFVGAYPLLKHRYFQITSMEVKELGFAKLF